jgi:protein-disulfide isomerase
MVARGSGQAVPEVDPTPTVATTPNDDPTPDPNPQDGLYAASAIHATAKPKKDAIIVEMHVDYHCGWCRVADLTYGPALRELSDSNQIDFRVQIRSFVNPESSQRAGVAAACAHKEGFFLAYHETIFNNQSRGQGGYSDEMLREEFAQQAGLKGKNLTKFQSCYDQSATLNDIQTMEREAVQMGINGTPAFIVNGVKAQFPLDKDNTQPMSADDLMEGLVSITTG